MTAAPLIGLSVLIVAAATLVLAGEGPVLGLEPSQAAGLAYGVAAMTMLAGVGARVLRGNLRLALQAAAFWTGATLLLAAAYAQRDALRDLGLRTFAELVPGRVVETRAGEVTVARRLDGAFVLRAEVNGAALPLTFDTGASAVVLTPAGARAAGFDPGSLSYDAVVATANGQARAATVRLRRVAVGPVEVANVTALVAREGALSENLLGRTFLDRLASYEVRDGRLTLRGR